MRGLRRTEWWPMTDSWPTAAEAGRYARAVLSGRVPACKWARLACARRSRDLALAYPDSARKGGPRTSHPQGLWFDPASANQVIKFFRFLRHYKGEWAGQRFRPSPWQCFLLAEVFGWKREDGTRRFRTAYVEINRKNGKTTFGAALGLYMLVADGEPGAEVYAAATIRDQARICHDAAIAMAEQEPDIRKRLDIVRSRATISYPAADSFFRALGADEDSLDGLNPHCNVIDELHAWKSRDKWDKLTTAQGTRRQPLDFVITTAGDNRSSIGWEVHEYAERVLEGVVEDDSFFAVLYCLDRADPAAQAAGGQGAGPAGGETETEALENLPDADAAGLADDWRDEAVWPKANPNLGVSVKPEYLRAQVRKADGSPAYLNAVLRFHFGVWTRQTTRYIALEKWDLCAGPVDPAALAGRECFGGLDLASTTDLAAFVLVFPPAGPPAGDLQTSATPPPADGGEGDGAQDGGGASQLPPGDFEVLPFFWVPEEGLLERVRTDRVPYDRWRDRGLLEATEGNVIDYRSIRKTIETLGERYNIREIAFDRWGSAAISQDLQGTGFEMVQFGQGFASMSAPTKELLRLVLGGRIRHGGNPVLRWMVDNLSVRTDPADNVKPDKASSREKIDGVVALVMALDRAIRVPRSEGSVYEKEGIFFL